MLSFSLRLFSLLTCLALSFALHLSAASAKDIHGEWVVDGAATWDLMKKSPQLAAVPPEEQKMIQEMIITQSASMGFVVTADKLITSHGEKKKEASYKITAIDGDKLSTESTDANGKSEKIDITVKGETLMLSNVDQPGAEMMLKRKTATAK